MGGGFSDGLVSAYHKKYPNDRVEILSPVDLAEAVSITAVVREQMESGEVDLVPYFASLVREDRFLPLGALIQQAAFDLTPFGPGIEMLRHEGKLYRLPSVVRRGSLLRQRAGPGTTFG